MERFAKYALFGVIGYFIILLAGDSVARIFGKSTLEELAASAVDPFIKAPVAK